MTKYYQKQNALGSVVELCIVGELSQAQAEELLSNLWREVFVFERRCSRFLPGSELSFFNRRAGTKQFVTPQLRDILLAARRLGQETGGLYNPFILPALQAAGYTQSQVSGYQHDPQDNYSHKAVASVDELEIGDDWARIPFNSAIDLGGCGKGYLADQLAAMVAGQVSGFWLSLGGDIAVGGSDQGRPWRVAVQSARRPAEDIAIVTIPVDSRVGIATSGTITRKGTNAGQSWHHLIDPKTLRPAITDVQVTTVVHADTLHADVLASCAVILGSATGLDWLREQQCRAGLLQYEDRVASYGDCISIDAAASDIL